jgi:hypothetical protein
MLTQSHSYPLDNCAEAQPNNPDFTHYDPQAIFPQYLNHQSGLDLVNPYIPSIAIAQAAGKPFIMFETNTASCGGFRGISDSFGSALWAIDYGFQMASAGFNEALLHVSGQGVYYNVGRSSIYDLQNSKFVVSHLRVRHHRYLRTCLTLITDFIDC